MGGAPTHISDAQRRERVAFEIGAYEAFNHVLNWLNTLEEQVVDKGKIYKAVANLRPDLVHFAFPIRNLHPEGDGMTEDEAPEIGSYWLHRNGAGPYAVLFIANEPGSEAYPPMVVYQGANGKIWCRRLDDWHRSMTRCESTTLEYKAMTIKPRLYILHARMAHSESVPLDLVTYRIATDGEDAVVARYTRQLAARHPGYHLTRSVDVMEVAEADLAYLAPMWQR